MSNLHDLIQSSIEDVTKARLRITKYHGAQIRREEERLFISAIAHTWFQTRRPSIIQYAESDQNIPIVDSAYRHLLEMTEQCAAKSTYLTELKAIKGSLIHLRGNTVTIVERPVVPVSDIPPDFASLSGDQFMTDILNRRWIECARCVKADVPLAAVVMMGGLLEALFVARANKLQGPEKAKIFHLKSTPVDKAKKALDLREWTLSAYIDVGHELHWITQSGKDVASVLREYRNYIHPAKERAHGIVLQTTDASIFWEVAKSLAQQLLAS
jgi:hypothetical protein